MSEPAYVAEPDPPIDLSQLPISGDWTPYVELLGIGGFVRHPFTPMPIREPSPLRTDNPVLARNADGFPTVIALEPKDLPMTKYYRAKITLEEITPLSTPDSQTYENVRASELAEVTITAETPSAAMTQAANLAHQIVTTRARPAYRRQTAPEGGVGDGSHHYVAPAEAKKAPWAEAITPEPASDREVSTPKEPEKQ